MRATKPYTDAFKSDVLNLIRRRDRSLRQLSEDLGVNYWTLRGWYKKEEMAKRAPKKKPQVTTPPPEETVEQKVTRLERENARLERENASLRTDREILKKAAAFFAKESE